MRHTEAEPVSLTRSVVGILPQDHYAYRIEGCALERIEDVAAFRVHRVLAAFVDEVGLQVSEPGGRELVAQPLVPALSNIGPGCRVLRW